MSEAKRKVKRKPVVSLKDPAVIEDAMEMFFMFLCKNNSRANRVKREIERGKENE